MGLFSKKKEEKKELPPLKFPNFPPPEFPKYESEISEEASTIKSAVEPEIPIRKPMFKFPGIERPSIAPEPRDREERTLFIKIDKYKEVMKAIDKIKDKLDEVEKILDKLEEVKSEEDRELDKWNQDLKDLKERLLSIDKTLFESG